MQRRVQHAFTRRHLPTGDGAPRRPDAGIGRQLLWATLTAGLLATLWFAWLDRAQVSDIRPVIAGLVAIGLIAGLVARSWWTTALAPAIIIGLSSLMSAVSCARGCPPTPEDTPFTVFMLQIINSGIPAALGAAGGTLLGKLLARRPLNQPGQRPVDGDASHRSSGSPS